MAELGALLLSLIVIAGLAITWISSKYSKKVTVKDSQFLDGTALFGPKVVDFPTAEQITEMPSFDEYKEITELTLLAYDETFDDKKLLQDRLEKINLKLEDICIKYPKYVERLQR